MRKVEILSIAALSLAIGLIIGVVATSNVSPTWAQSVGLLDQYAIKFQSEYDSSLANSTEEITAPSGYVFKSITFVNYASTVSDANSANINIGGSAAATTFRLDAGDSCTVDVVCGSFQWYGGTGTPAVGYFAECSPK